jgi:hypothetical protein
LASAALLFFALWAILSLAASRPGVAAGGNSNHIVDLWGIGSAFGRDQWDKDKDKEPSPRRDKDTGKDKNKNTGKDKDKDKEPKCESPKPLVTDPGPDGRVIAIGASSEYTTQYDSALASRMDKGGWAAKESDMHPWLEWDFGGQDALSPVMATIMKVQTLGRQWNDGQYITSYILDYTEDGSHWKTHPTIFKGSQAWNKTAEAEVTPALQARKVRMRMTSWQQHAACKVELIGCFHEGKANGARSAAHTSGAHTSAADTSGAHTPAADTSVVPTSATSTSTAHTIATAVTMTTTANDDTSGAHTLAEDTSVVPTSANSTSTAHTIATAVTKSTMANDNNDCTPEGWKRIYHPGRREWWYMRCTPNTFSMRRAAS